MLTKYELIEHDNSFHENHWAIRIEDGEYEGVAFQYDTVSFTEENSDIVLSFNTVTLDNPNNKDLKSEEFEGIIGGILTDIIEKNLEELEKNEQNGTGDSKASNQ